ncbi:hypothetical protein LTR62_008767 [Meristemomyces frigidus]|uniref:DUF7730 domain-containing protein n=1 Tax=Meristemomyces frigidus TaxID=1508187 RepID=A0AAN7TAB1_9PEZI|nr:hypothetical protein LTR62_008767 [Meristemomyces frigidus]
MTTATSSKRKRAQVTYTKDSDLDELLGITANDDKDIPMNDLINDIDDYTYGSRKPTNSARKAKKAKLIAKTPKKKQNAKPFRFLDLSAELRNRIYELALIDPNGISLVAKTKSFRRTVRRGLVLDNEDGESYWNSRRRNRCHASEHGGEAGFQLPVLVPALLAVNKQIYAEAIGYLYQQAIAVEDTYALHTFVAGLGSHSSRVVHLTVKGWGHGRGTHKAAVSAC